MAYSATSPTRSMIKEANDHLQLLHHRVQELEMTVHEQSEAIVKQDEEAKIKIQEVSMTKDQVIHELRQTVQGLSQRVQSLEQMCQDKDAKIAAALSSQQELFAELAGHVPSLTRLMGTLQKLPVINSNSFNHGRGHQENHVDGGQRKLDRSFKINSNFSMSEDETEEEF